VRTPHFPTERTEAHIPRPLFLIVMNKVQGATRRGKYAGRSFADFHSGQTIR
jgi:hypothetical protein